MHDDTTELPTYNRAVGGTDPHPTTVEDLIGRIDSQLDTVWAAADLRGYVAGAQALQDAVHELVLLTQSLEGRAGEHAEMLRSTAEAVLDDSTDDYDAVMDRAHGGPVTRPDWQLVIAIVAGLAVFAMGVYLIAQVAGVI